MDSELKPLLTDAFATRAKRMPHSLSYQHRLYILSLVIASWHSYTHYASGHRRVGVKTETEGGEGGGQMMVGIMLRKIGADSLGVKHDRGKVKHDELTHTVY